MKKLKLEIESLEVESFELRRDSAPFGTVKGREYSSGPMGCNNACYSDDPCYTHDPSCEQTCNATCDYSCMCVSNEVACIDP